MVGRSNQSVNSVRRYGAAIS